MAYTSIVRAANGKNNRYGSSAIITLPKAIREFIGIDIGDKLELTPMTTDSFIVRLKR